MLGLRLTISKIMSYTKASTILLRDSLVPPEDPQTTSPEAYSDSHVAVTSHSSTIYERVGSLIFTFAANSFFQNNNSILEPLTTYVQEAIFPPSINGSTTSNESARRDPTHLVDTYCGSGLFALSLASRFERVSGVEIAPESIVAAKENARINGITNVEFLCAKSEEIFTGLSFKGDESCVIVDVSAAIPTGLHITSTAVTARSSSRRCAHSSRLVRVATRLSSGNYWLFDQRWWCTFHAMCILKRGTLGTW